MASVLLSPTRLGAIVAARSACSPDGAHGHCVAHSDDVKHAACVQHLSRQPHGPGKRTEGKCEGRSTSRLDLAVNLAIDVTDPVSGRVPVPNHGPNAATDATDAVAFQITDHDPAQVYVSEVVRRSLPGTRVRCYMVEFLGYKC